MFSNIKDRIRLLFRKDRESYLRFYKMLGFYPKDISIYEQALLHKSLSVKSEKGRLLNNERLEFLGDAILDAVVAYNTAAKAYGNNRIETATPAELTLMLYEGAVKFCNIAIVGLEKNDYEKVNTNIQKCRNIIVELTSTLNMKYPVAEDFKRMYDYIFALLTEANMKKDMELLERALEELRGMRDVWKEVMTKAKGPQLSLS